MPRLDERGEREEETTMVQSWRDKCRRRDDENEPIGKDRAVFVEVSVSSRVTLLPSRLACFLAVPKETRQGLEENKRSQVCLLLPLSSVPVAADSQQRRRQAARRLGTVRRNEGR